MYTRIALRSTRTALNLRTMATTRQIVHTDSAPAAIGPYSQAIAVGNLLYTSGQIPLDPKTMQIVEGGVDAQTRQVLDNLKAVLEAGGSSLENVVKTTVFLKDIKDFESMNKIYAEYFSAKPPARSAIQIGKLPKDSLVEIEAVAAII